MAKYKRKRKIGNSLTRKLLILLLLAVTLFAATAWGASARYTYRSEKKSVVKAKEFYFTSDYLVPGGTKHVLNPGTTSVTFELRNYDGLKVSELPVKYTVKSGEAVLAEGSIDGPSEQAVQVQLQGLTPGTSYTVTAEGSNGYKRTLSATFVVMPSTDGIYKNTANYDDYVLLTVWARGQAGTATVTIPAGVIPDYTDTALKGKTAGGTLEVSLAADTSQTFRFFTTGAYANGPVTVTAGGDTLSETALN